MRKNAISVFNSYTVNGVIYTRKARPSIAKKFLIAFGILAFMFAYGLAGRADFCGEYPKAAECSNGR